MKQQTQIKKIEWREVEIGELLDYEQPGNYIVQSEILKEKTKNSVPVLTANKSFILGYTEEKEGIYNNLPVIIFDDFTTDTKFVDFKFKVKSSAMKLLRPKSKDVNSKFVFLMMKGIQLNFSTHKRYYLSVYQKRKILMPFKENKLDLKEQKRIVKILEKAEKLKEGGKNANDLLDEYLKSIFYEMFYEKGFEDVNLGNKQYFEIQGGGTPSRTKKEYWENGKIPWIGSTACKDLPVNKAEQFITEKGLKNSSAKLFPKGTLLIALVGATIGKTGILTFECSTNQNIAGMIIKDKDKINSTYLFFSLKGLYNQFISLSNASFKMANLSFIRSLKIPLPPLPLQQKFSRIVEQIEKMKENVNKTKQNSEELFNSLVSKAFRGEL